MATLRNKRTLAAVTRETQEEHPRNGQSRNTSGPRINEEYITQLSEEIEGRVTKKLSQEYSRTKSRILGALSKLDEFLLNQQIRMHSGTVPETFRNTKVDNQGTNEDDSMSDPHPEAGLYTKLWPRSWSLQNPWAKPPKFDSMELKENSSLLQMVVITAQFSIEGLRKKLHRSHDNKQLSFIPCLSIISIGALASISIQILIVKLLCHGWISASWEAEKVMSEKLGSRHKSVPRAQSPHVLTSESPYV